MPRLLPPAGTPVRCSELISAWTKRLTGSANEFALADKVRQRTGTPHIFLTNSGRTGLLIILETLKELADTNRTEVVIPAYTCYSVAAAIARAGLKIRLVDIRPETMDYDYDRLEDLSSERILAIVGCNLFGLPSDMNRISLLAKRIGAFAIDDAAQGMGLIENNHSLGCRGDVGFYSLDRGKNMTTLAGGVILTRSDQLADLLKEKCRRLPLPGLISEMIVCLKLNLYLCLIQPRIYWLPAALPFLGLGQTIYDTSFPTTRLSRFQSILGSILIDHLDRFNDTRQANSLELASTIVADDRYSIPGFDPDNCPSYLRLPVLCQTRELRDQLIICLRKNGVVASNMYPGLIADINKIQDRLVDRSETYEGADRIVESLLVLPTNPYVNQSDIQNMTRVLKEA